MTDHLGQGDKSASRREIGRWMLTVALLLMGVAISLDIELHVLAGSVLLVAAALTIVVAYRLDKSGKQSLDPPGASPLPRDRVLRVALRRRGPTGSLTPEQVAEYCTPSLTSVVLRTRERQLREEKPMPDSPAVLKADLVPLLMPSGRQWSEQWLDCDPPPLVHYDWHHYRPIWRGRIRGAVICELADHVPIRARVLRAFGRYVPPGAYATAQQHRSFCPGGDCVTMGWRFAIGPDLKPWEPGDKQPQDGHWPISIAVFGRSEVAAADALHMASMRAARWSNEQ